MQILLAYYSRTGATEKVGLRIAQALGGDTEKISDVKSRAGAFGYLMSGREAMLGKCPAIGSVKYSPESYDLVIIGTPVWAGNMSAPIRTYLTREKDKIKKFALFLTQGGSGAERAKNKIESLMGRPAVASVVLLTQEVISGSMAEKIDLFVKQIKSLI